MRTPAPEAQALLFNEKFTGKFSLGIHNSKAQSILPLIFNPQCSILKDKQPAAKTSESFLFPEGFVLKHAFGLKNRFSALFRL